MGTLANLWQNHRMLMVFVMILIVVIPFLIFYLNKAKKEHPKGLIAAALSNMGERFGYYIMNAVLVLFICSKFGISDVVSGVIFAVFYFLIYVLALPGGIIADRKDHYLGHHRDGHRLWTAFHSGVQRRWWHEVMAFRSCYARLSPHRLR